VFVIPAIDIKGGKVVRLTQGLADRETVYSESPVAIAEKWASLGAELIHVVDLDGALQGELKNLKVAGEIARSVKAKIELGGGIRDIGSIERALDTGIEKVCIGTKALDKKFLAEISKSNFREMVVVSIDSKDGFVRTKGWVEKTKVTAEGLIKEIAKFGITTVEYTNISQDGTLQGPDIYGIKKLLAIAELDIIASGGVATIGDVKKLKALEKDGLKGVIIGKALYEGKIDLGEAIKICSQKE